MHKLTRNELEAKMTEEKNNTGNWNTGDWNTGYRNTGDCNTGNWNTGDWNTGDWNTGFFNTITPNRLFFNKEFTGDIENVEFPDFCYFDLTKWISEAAMTDKEKEENPTYKTTGGYLKKFDYKEAFKNSWEIASKEDREKLFKLPNFDADIFFEISGIDVRKTNDEIIELNGKKYKLIKE